MAKHTNNGAHFERLGQNWAWIFLNVYVCVCECVCIHVMYSAVFNKSIWIGYYMQ